jgi:CubicO group peptidase (beta-lactamase class C family)
MIALDQPTVEIQAQERIQALLDRMVRTGEETGLQVAAYRNGELVIDACAGVANPTTGERVTHDTLFVAFSCSKGVLATLIHQMVEKGQLDYDTPIARYWPEFAQNGKGTITVRHALTHQAGIPQMPRGMTIETLCNWDTMRRGIEGLKPLWTPGTKTGYHGLTYGFILGEVAQRVDGRPLARMVQEDICQPLGISDLYFGLPRALESRVAVLGGSRVPWHFLPPFFLLKRVIPGSIAPGPLWNDPRIHQALIPAGNMITTARAMAKHYAALVGTGVDGVRLLSPERVKIVSALQTETPDQVFFGAPIRKGLGYWVGGDKMQDAFGTRASVFGHTGAGGAIGFADPEYNFSFALLKNQMTWRGGDDTDVKIVDAVREALGIPH